MASTPVLPEEVERGRGLFGDLLETAARLPLRLLQLPLLPIALGSVTASVVAMTFQANATGFSTALFEYGKRMAITFGVGGAAVFAVKMLPEHRWPRGTVLGSRYLRQVLVLAMLWQAVATVLLSRPIVAWLQMSHALFAETGGAEHLLDPDMGSGFAFLIALALYFWPASVALAALATLVVSVAVTPAAWCRSRALPGLLLAAALTQSVYWGGAIHALDLADRLMVPVRREIEVLKTRDGRGDAPQSVADRESEKKVLDFLAQPEQVGRPATRQLGWLLFAPWVFIPAIWWKGRKPEERHALGAPPRSLG